MVGGAMKSLMLSAWLFGGWLFAQPPDESKPESKPAASNVLNAEYPRVYPDGRAAFRFTAPNASKVQLNGGAGLGAVPIEMTKGEGGGWTVTIPPAAPGFHYYWFVVDGVQMNDPAS